MTLGRYGSAERIASATRLVTTTPPLLPSFRAGSSLCPADRFSAYRCAGMPAHPGNRPIREYRRGVRCDGSRRRLQRRLSPEGRRKRSPAGWGCGSAGFKSSADPQSDATSNPASIRNKQLVFSVSSLYQQTGFRIGLIRYAGYFLLA